MRAESDLLELRDKPEKKLTLRPGETRELAFRWSAPRAGKASLRFKVESSVLQESLEAALNVESSWVREAVTIVGMTEDSVREGLAVPERFLGLPEEGLELTLDSTIASGLVEAIRFLELYPYDCLEQRTSKLFAYVLYDWLADNRSAVERELAALPAYQTGDGGFTYWQDQLLTAVPATTCRPAPRTCWPWRASAASPRPRGWIGRRCSATWRAATRGPSPR